MKSAFDTYYETTERLIKAQKDMIESQSDLIQRQKDIIIKLCDMCGIELPEGF